MQPTAVEELLDADGSVVVVLERDASVRTINPAALRLLGVRSIDDVALGSPAYATLRSLLDHVPRRLLDGNEVGTWHGDLDHTDPNGAARVYRATVISRHDASGGHVAVAAHDVTAARHEAADLRHRASHDPLTGLANRRSIVTTLQHAVAAQRGQTGHVAALFIDLDRLKYVNDALGHDVGDRLLAATARRLSETVRPIDNVARIGGDEFLVVCTDMPDPITALDLAERIRSGLSGRLKVRDLDLQISVSIGIALTDPGLLTLADDHAASELISNADTAMYQAKTTGRGRSVLFTPHLQASTRERTELAAALAHASARNELQIDYQPVFSAVTRTAVGAEALLRWHHPTRGRIDPDTFIEIAEESGTIARLGEHVLRSAVADMQHWIDSGLVDDDFAVHVNVSQVQLASASFVDQVLSIIRTHRIGPSRLVLEARESAFVSGNVDVQRTVRALRRVGVRVAVDNFGTGASALSVLTDVGADFLKLDGSLALPAGSSDSDVRVVRALVLLAHALDMLVVAERVSSADQLKRLRAAGCDFVQGKLLAAPVPAEHVAPLLNTTMLSDRFDE